MTAATLTRPVARCATSPDRWAWFSTDPDAQAYAKGHCAACPLRAGCLDDAKQRDELWGIWGGQDFTAQPLLMWEAPSGARHGERAMYVRCTAGPDGGKCQACKSSNARYIAARRAEGPVTAAPRIEPDQLLIDFGRTA